MRRDIRKVLSSMPARKIETPFQSKHGHRVTPNPGGWFDVASGRSGRIYPVIPLGGQHATCGRPGVGDGCQGFAHTQLPCSHIAAVIEYASVVLQQQALKKLRRQK